MKIIIINHTFQKEQFCKRWRDLAKQHKDWEITLLAPSEWTWGSGKAVTFGKEEKKQGFEYLSENYQVKQIDIKNHKFISWTSVSMINIIRDINPDCIYHIGSHTQESLMQILDYKRKENSKVKIFAFSMRGPQQNLDNIKNLRKEDSNYIKKCFRSFQYLYEKYKVKKLNKFCDAIFCHYPDGMECFRNEGFKKPIFMQTQVGVDTQIFYPDKMKREKIRARYNISDDTYLFASAVRFNPSKGIMEILEALPLNGKWKYLLMGSGLPQEIEVVKKKIQEKGLEGKVILTGFIDWEYMSEYWNAADCAIHFTQTTTSWVETFSLSLVQAMATGLPVIGSDSGSVPYQIGPDGIVINEKNIKELNKKICWIMNNPSKGKLIGEKLYKRTIKSFSTEHLNNLFYVTVMDLLKDKYVENQIDMANTSIE